MEQRDQKVEVVDCKYPYELKEKIQNEIDRFKARGYTLQQTSSGCSERTGQCFSVLIFKKE